MVNTDTDTATWPSRRAGRAAKSKMRPRARESWMMTPPPEAELEALKAALALAVFPSTRRRLRNAPLPQGVALLLRIVTDDREVIDACAKRLQRRPEELQEAAAFYIEQILLTPRADCY